MFIDAAGVSATFLMTAPIAEDLHIGFADEAWILGTYSMVFAATRECFFLFFGVHFVWFLVGGGRVGWSPGPLVAASSWRSC